MSYGERLRRAREGAEMGRPELSERIDAARSSIWRWEVGAHEPQPRHQARINRVLGVEPTCPLPERGTFGDSVRQARRERGWSQAELGERIGVSQRAVASWELDNKRPYRKHRVRLACLLGIDCLTRAEAVRAARDAILAVHEVGSLRYDGPTADDILTAHAGGWDVWGEEDWGELCREALEAAKDVNPDVSKVPHPEREEAA